METEKTNRRAARRASILASFEPVVASAVGILAFGELLGALTIVGIVCVLAGVWILR
ncbi:EamA family transporter [Oscillibacter sp.]|uniref:EamA family transporter n=1 Tax=Oscillibacter sp. TaxID=1945593 RepID=UPI002605840B|nr:EamA family transporter [Oscillibacter sp.]MDD3347462.1 EamA family transporter [Oscillibacter sp.]